MSEDTMTKLASVILCPGQGAQSVGMGSEWYRQSPVARATFDEADALLEPELGAKLSDLCFNGPSERLNKTDVSQPAIYVCSIACYRAICEQGEIGSTVAAAGLSLGEYTALHIAGAFDFAEGLKLVSVRGRYMQEAAEASKGSMVALIGADEAQAEQVCDRAAAGEILVPANCNAPGQIVLSGHASACDRAVKIAGEMGLRASALTVAGAFHSPLMQPAAEKMAATLENADIRPLRLPVWSNVTAEPHDPENLELLRNRLVEQIIRPVKWSQSCTNLLGSDSFGGECSYREMAPGSVLRGLMRRIDRSRKVVSHENPD